MEFYHVLPSVRRQPPVQVHLVEVGGHAHRVLVVQTQQVILLGVVLVKDLQLLLTSSFQCYGWILMATNGFDRGDYKQ